MSNRDEERIKELLKSVRPEYDKAGLWDQLEDKLPQAEKKRGRSVWLFLFVGLLLGAGLSYSWFQFGVHGADSQHQYAGSEAQNSNSVIFDENVADVRVGALQNSTKEQVDSKVKKTALKDVSAEDMISSAKNASSRPVVLQEQQATERTAESTDNADKATGKSAPKSENNKVNSKLVLKTSDNQNKDVDSAQAFQETKEDSYESFKNSSLSSILLGESGSMLNNSRTESLIYGEKPLPNLQLVYLANDSRKLKFIEFPIVKSELKARASRDFLTVQTTSSVLFTESGYSSDSEEWNTFIEDAINPVWNQGINIAYERSIGSGWYATIGLRTSLFTERLETVMENAHQPDVHYSDTAFYYKFDNGIINYYGGESEYQDKEVRRVGQYNQSLSLGAQIGVKYIKSWSRWSVVPEVSFYAMPYSFTTGKSISQEFDIVQRSTEYQGFYGFQGQCALEYRVSSKYRIFAGLNYQSDLSNRLRNQSQMVSAAGLTFGTRVNL